MANIMDYLAWRGDITVAASPMGEVDSLILCNLSCIDLTDFAPGKDSTQSASIGELSEKYFSGRENEKMRLGALQPETALPMFKELKNHARFKDMRISDYVNKVDGKGEEQFCAMCVSPGDGVITVIYRGTDDTIVGWKENFNMSYLASVPAQRDAAKYLTEIARKYSGPIRVAGHSKGGNLAVYAAANCEKSFTERIVEIYNYDGPGFRRAVMEQEGFSAITGRVKTIVPQSSVVGMLLEHGERYDVVKSTASGVYQHDGFSWEILGTKFIHLETVTESSRYIDRTLSKWLEGLTEQERRQFVDTLFLLLESTGAKTLTELSEGGIKQAIALAENMRQMDENSKAMMRKAMKLLLKSAAPRFELPKNNKLLAEKIRIKKKIPIKKGENPAR
ncbi:MAG: DUF2974 domain-containing protein [Eubacteriaceae bacterium]|nr:DUF2974 domain-containing protein [Eubacteriaceae bacterium]